MSPDPSHRTISAQYELDERDLTSTSYYFRSGSSSNSTICIEGSAQTNLVHLNVIAGGSGEKDHLTRAIILLLITRGTHFMLTSNTYLSFGHARTTPQVNRSRHIHLNKKPARPTLNRYPGPPTYHRAMEFSVLCNLPPMQHSHV